MKWALVIVLVLLAACVTVVERTEVVNETNRTIDTVSTVPPLPEESCKPDSLLLFAAKDGREIGLAGLTLEDKGTYYKVTGARIYARADAWYMNDVTLEFSEPGSGLMEFNRQQLAFAPSSGCVVQDMNFSIAVKDIANPKQVVLKLGQGQSRSGAVLVTAQGTLDLTEFVR